MQQMVLESVNQMLLTRSMCNGNGIGNSSVYEGRSAVRQLYASSSISPKVRGFQIMTLQMEASQPGSALTRGLHSVM
jgi:hypothetical protein